MEVDTRTHRPAIDQGRFEARRRLGITADKFVMLFTGRLSHHSKSQPLPMFVAAQHVAEQLGNDVCLVLAGWFSNDIVRRAFAATARRAAPNVRLSIVDGMDPWWRQHAWDTADVFISLADSIQETFGLTPLEAMSRGIPVVASDWNGYRDIVIDGETGFLIPTTMVAGASTGLAQRLQSGEINYDHFLASAGQTVNVSIDAACRSLLCLAQQLDLRRRMSIAGRRCAKESFSWPAIIKRYETIWESQREQLRSSQLSAFSFQFLQSHKDTAVHYPPIDVAFRSYPSQWITDDQIAIKAFASSSKLAEIFADPLCNHSLHWSDFFNRLVEDYQAAPTSLTTKQWIERWLAIGVAADDTAGILAWLCKYGALYIESTALAAGQAISHADLHGERIGTSRRFRDQESNELPGTSVLPLTPLITFVTTCQGRLDDLKQTLPNTSQQPHSTVIVVDYSCPQNAGDWVREHFPAVQVVAVPGKDIFDRSDAKNAGGFAVQTPWLCLLDCDIVLHEDFCFASLATAQTERNRT